MSRRLPCAWFIDRIVSSEVPARSLATAASQKLGFQLTSYSACMAFQQLPAKGARGNSRGRPLFKSRRGKA
jgi:hypothetical protein